jgi:hypothetical protein
MELLLILGTGLINVLCFFVGAKVGQTVAKGKEVELPTINPMEAYKQHQEKREAEKEKQINDIILENIDNYDGTANGQKDVPWR